jgi:hypothetical protein
MRKSVYACVRKKRERVCVCVLGIESGCVGDDMERKRERESVCVCECLRKECVCVCWGKKDRERRSVFFK